MLGETIAIETFDASGGQLHPNSPLSHLTALDFDRINPVTRPVYVEGAKPRDAVEVTFRAFHPMGWGRTANISGFGLLAEAFPGSALHIWDYYANLCKPAAFAPMGQAVLQPFVGTLAWH